MKMFSELWEKFKAWVTNDDSQPSRPPPRRTTSSSSTSSTAPQVDRHATWRRDLADDFTHLTLSDSGGRAGTGTRGHTGSTGSFSDGYSRSSSISSSSPTSPTSSYASISNGRTRLSSQYGGPTSSTYGGPSSTSYGTQASSTYGGPVGGVRRSGGGDQNSYHIGQANTHAPQPMTLTNQRPRSTARRSTPKARTSQGFVYHYTDRKGIRGIKQSSNIRSTVSDEIHARMGPGVYFTAMGPEHSTEEILQNNYHHAASHFRRKTQHYVKIAKSEAHFRKHGRRDLYIYDGYDGLDLTMVDHEFGERDV